MLFQLWKFHLVHPSIYKHLDSATDIVLADLATELNTYDGNLIYNHERYIATNGVRKYMDPFNGSWRAVLTARKVG
jgi:hypothetical protein